MGAGHAHPFYRDGDSLLHRAPPEVKIACLFVFVVAVVATPRETFWPYALYGALIVVHWCLAGIPLRWILSRMSIEVPFLLLAVLLPFSAGGDRIDVAGLSLSVSGLYAAWGIVIKGTLGVAASLTVAATTPARELLSALGRLGVPAIVTSVLVLMLRYIDVLSAEAGRMRMARLSRGDSPRSLHQAAAIATSAGALFVRSYERGERVYLAMLSRGFEGRVPELAMAGRPRATVRQWSLAMVPAAAAVLVSVAARVVS